MKKFHLAIVMFFSLGLPSQIYAQSRVEFINKISKSLNSENIIEAIGAAEQALSSDDRVTRQLLLEPVLQHKDRRVRQIGFMYLVKTMQRLQIDITIPENPDKRERAKDALYYFNSFRIMQLELKGYDEKSGKIESNYNSRIDQSGLIVIPNGECKINMTGADNGYIVGFIDCYGITAQAKISLP
jgi:hypothetical protein